MNEEHLVRPSSKYPLATKKETSSQPESTLPILLRCIKAIKKEPKEVKIKTPIVPDSLEFWFQSQLSKVLEKLSGSEPNYFRSLEVQMLAAQCLTLLVLVSAKEDKVNLV